MARADQITSLSLDRYARIVGINPAHFNQLATSDNDVPMPITSSCSDVWFQHDWQSSDRVSREQLARMIRDAEQEIAEELGFWPGPVWIEKEMHPFPRHHRRDVYDQGRNVRGARKSVQAEWGYFIDAGQRGSTFLGLATEGGGELVYSDPDGDGYDELATITFATVLTDPCEINAYFPGEGGDQFWEIRDAISKEIAGGFAILKFFTWQLTDPAIWERFPTINEPLGAVKINEAGVRLTEVDVYREFTDFSQPSAQFFWENSPELFPLFNSGTGCASCNGDACPSCTLQTLDGCLHVRDVETGLIVPVPAEFDADTGQFNVVRPFPQCRAPDIVKVFYRAGDINQRFLAGRTCDPLKNYWAEVIAWLVTARLYRPLCNCGTVEKFVANMQRDMAKTEPDGTAYIMSEGDLENPFGTRRGEVKAWRRISKLARQVSHVAVI